MSLGKNTISQTSTGNTRKNTGRLRNAGNTTGNTRKNTVRPRNTGNTKEDTISYTNQRRKRKRRELNEGDKNLQYLQKRIRMQDDIKEKDLQYGVLQGKFRHYK